MQAAAPNPSSLDDDALLRRIRAGDRDAFSDLMRRYNRRLYRVARSVLRDDAEAEDALQDAYLQAYRALPGFRGDSALGTWLTRIVVNAALMRQRKTRRLADVIELGADFGSDDAILPRDRLDEPAQPELAALRAQTRRLIETGIDKLPAAFRTVFVLRAVEELTVEETAATLDIPAATVRTRYFRARAMLREALAREIDFAIEDAFGFDGARCDRIVDAVRRRLDAEPSP
ncbi:RNA polymerase subunit sigma [Massilia sp. Root133]|uniref:RNA polymerase sigma factor n=1 Tax=unclassified Massilia TaxID=2609279 RepID=UPI000700435D|nr:MULTISPECIES: RNA polymerase sigma factor [unclassified Massilia]KQX96741.1 RNA polymerase subunit sigma [Massilia sp. Root133]KQZ52452.1 RNA polymerase subunit sigma [Massilia sp. Root1485]